jgi:hypothetical protein
MRLLVNLVLCLIAAAVIASGTAAALFVAKELVPRRAPAQQKAKAPIVGPRVQAWLDRKAEELAYAEKEKAAALAERERAEALRAQTPPPLEHAAMARARNAEENEGARIERARRSKQAARQEAKRRLRLQQMEAERAYGYASERRWSSYPNEFLTRRDRYGY